MRADALEDRARFELMEDVGRHYRARLGIDDARLSGENLVRGLTALVFADRLSGAARTRARSGGPRVSPGQQGAGTAGAPAVALRFC